MDHLEIQEYLLDFQKRALPELAERRLASGLEKERILYLNFEDPRLVDVHFKEIRDIIKIHWQLYPASISKKCIIFFDEPQMIDNWEIAIRP